MDDVNLTEALGQVSASEAGVIFRNFLRGGVRQMICEVMAAEVTELCGPKHHPNNSVNVRAGSSSGRVIAYHPWHDPDRAVLALGRRREPAELKPTKHASPNRSCGHRHTTSNCKGRFDATDNAAS